MSRTISGGWPMEGRTIHAGWLPCTPRATGGFIMLGHRVWSPHENSLQIWL